MSGYAPNPSFHSEDSYAPLTASLLARKGEAMPAVDAVVHEGVDIDMAPSMPGMGPSSRPGSSHGSGAAPSAASQQFRAANESEAARYASEQDDYEPDLSEDVNANSHADDLDDYTPTAYAPNDDAVETVSPEVIQSEPIQAEPVQAEPVEERAAFPGAAGSTVSRRRGWTVSGPSIGGPAADVPVETPPIENIPPIENVKARLRRRARRAVEAGKAGRKATITFRMPARDLIRLRFASRDFGVACQTIILEAVECYLEANDIAPLSDEDFAAETDRLMRLKKEKARRRSG